MYGGLGPARMKEFGLKTEKDLFTPETNVRAAKQILGSQGLGAWSVYKGGQYKKFLPEAQKADTIFGASPSSNRSTSTRNSNKRGPNIFNFWQSGRAASTCRFLRGLRTKFNCREKTDAAANWF
jgi:hypothetical protein